MTYLIGQFNTLELDIDVYATEFAEALEEYKTAVGLEFGIDIEDEGSLFSTPDLHFKGYYPSNKRWYMQKYRGEEEEFRKRKENYRAEYERARAAFHRLYGHVVKARKLRPLCRRVERRVHVMRLIASLGELLREYPLWVRGGQPIAQLGPQRPYKDVADERANQIRRMPKYQALCRMEEGEKIVEHHIRTVHAEERWQPQKDDPTERIKARSRQLYGVDITEVEKMLAARLDFAEEGRVDHPPTPDDIETVFGE